MTDRPPVVALEASLTFLGSRGSFRPSGAGTSWYQTYLSEQGPLMAVAMPGQAVLHCQA